MTYDELDDKNWWLMIKIYDYWSKNGLLVSKNLWFMIKILCYEDEKLVYRW